MNKSAIALALTAALAATAAATARAETTLYGSARVSVDWTDVSLTARERANLNPDPNVVNDLNSNWDLVNNASRLGVKGSEDLGGGLSAIYQFEFGVDMTEGGNFNNNRPKWVGLKGGFGSFMAGTQWTPYYNVIGIADVFNSDKYAFTLGNYNYLGPTRTDNTIAYVTPSFGGFEVQAALMMNGLQRGINTTTGTPSGAVIPRAGEVVNSPLPNTTADIDAYNISGIYKNGPLFAGVTWVQSQGDNPRDITDIFDAGDRGTLGVGLGYTIGPVSLAFTYEDGDIFGAPLGIGKNEAQNYYGNISWTLGNAILRAGYGYVDVSPESEIVRNDLTSGDFNIQNIVLGAQYNLSKRTRAWIEYLDRDGDDVIADQQVVSIGMRHDF